MMCVMNLIVVRSIVEVSRHVQTWGQPSQIELGRETETSENALKQTRINEPANKRTPSQTQINTGQCNHYKVSFK